ncbi:MAG: hypothetical protein ABWZ25_07450 [Chitinophagaceae bacterium]
MKYFSPGPEERADKAPTQSEEYQESIYPLIYEKNISDGGEFLDDALRMKEQLLGSSGKQQNQ